MSMYIINILYIHIIVCVRMHVCICVDVYAIIRTRECVYVFACVLGKYMCVRCVWL